MNAIWYLEGFEAKSQKIVRSAIRTLPFSVGRRSSCDLSLGSSMVSQKHAELFERGETLWLRDLGSTNGTFVNGKRVSRDRDQLLEDGDILHFADLEYRLVRNVSEDTSWPALTKTLNLKDLELPGGEIGRYRELREMLRLGAVTAHFQPLVSLADDSLLGYEALGRGALDDAPSSPGDLFAAADAIGLAAELSVVFRDKGIEEARLLPEPSRIFLNTHPAELLDHQALLATLETLAARRPEFEVVLEVHESAITHIDSLRGLRRELDRLGIEVAFDDFGTGQARLLELAEAAPHYLKFDAALIHDIHLASRQRLDMVGTLAKLVVDMGIVAIAEGVERLEEADACRRLGFQYAQGYLFGRPASAAQIAAELSETEVP